MTHPCCSPCRARFRWEPGIAPETCPQCGRSTERLPVDRILGFRLVEVDGQPEMVSRDVAVAVAAALPLPGPPRA